VTFNAANRSAHLAARYTATMVVIGRAMVFMTGA